MGIWLRSGEAGFRWDGYELFGRPPVLSPPRWAWVHRMWEAIGETAAFGPPAIMPEDWLERAVGAIPRRTGRLALVVPDATRTGPWRSLLPGLLNTLRSRGSSRILLIASGTHRSTGEEETLRHLFGARGDAHNLLEGWDLIHNGEGEFRDHVDLGHTGAGTPVRLHPRYVGADHRILLGGISYHYFAGIGGGPKLVFPGLAEPAGAIHNHRLALTGDSSKVWNPQCASGAVTGNPVHRDLAEAAGLRPPEWVITVQERAPVDPDPALPAPFPVTVTQGGFPSAFEEAMRIFEGTGRVPYTKAPELLIADAGGAPRDASFLQAHKSLQHGARFLRQGGRLLLVARCDQGFASAGLERWSDLPGAAPEEAIPAGPSGALGEALHLQTAVALRQALEKVRVALWSELPPERVRNLGMVPVGGEEEARAWLAEAGAGPFWGWLPRAERFLPSKGWLGESAP